MDEKGRCVVECLLFYVARFVCLFVYTHPAGQGVQAASPPNEYVPSAHGCAVSASTSRHLFLRVVFCLVLILFVDCFYLLYVCVVCACVRVCVLCVLCMCMCVCVLCMYPGGQGVQLVAFPVCVCLMCA